MKCPFCGCQTFYIKDADDEFETYGFDGTSGEVCFNPEIDASDIPDVCNDSHIYCEKCAWNGKFAETKK